jgi:small subunit ribosomal protein SAe
MSKSSPLALKEADLRLMVAAKVHLGTKNCDPNMQRYIWKRKADGVYLHNLGKTWEKLMLAARIIVAIENPKDVVGISARPFGQRAVFKFAQHTGAEYIAGRYTPGSFTNKMQKNFLEPRLLVVTDPRVDHQPVMEASYVNIPCIAFCDSDANVEHVDVVIPANNKNRQSIALLYWLLAREVNRLRNVISRTTPWEVMVDLFMYRDPEDTAKDAGAAAEEETTAVEVADDYAGGQDAPKVEWAGEHEANYTAPAQGNWGQQQQPQGQEWAGAAPAAGGWEQTNTFA